MLANDADPVILQRSLYSSKVHLVSKVLVSAFKILIGIAAIAFRMAGLEGPILKRSCMLPIHN